MPTVIKPNLETQGSIFYNTAAGDSYGCHRIWIGGHLVDYTPGSITLKTSNKTEVKRMVDDSYITISKKDDPFEYSFDFWVPIFNPTQYNWRAKDASHYEGFHSHYWWKDYFWNLKNNDAERFNPIELVIERVDGIHTVEKVLLKDYSCVEDAEDDSAFQFSVTFQSYRMMDNQEVNADLRNNLILSRQARGWKLGRGLAGGGFSTTVSDTDYGVATSEDMKEVEVRKATGNIPHFTDDQLRLAKELDKLSVDEYNDMVQTGRMPKWYQMYVGLGIPRREHATDPME